MTRISTLNLALGWTAFGAMSLIALTAHVLRAIH
jgi:hypothetical protein